MHCPARWFIIFNFARLDTISVKIQIAGRDYQMRVQAGEEQKVHRAADRLNESLTYYKQHGHIVEKQDLLSMVAFDAVFEKISQEDRNQAYLQSIESQIEELNQHLTPR